MKSRSVLARERKTDLLLLVLLSASLFSAVWFSIPLEAMPVKLVKITEHIINEGTTKIVCDEGSVQDIYRIEHVSNPSITVGWIDGTERRPKIHWCPGFEEFGEIELRRADFRPRPS